MKVITKVDNTKGGTKKPSDFTVTVSGNSPSPKSFPGSSSGTSVALKTGKYKVAGMGPSDYSIAYSSGCSGDASGGVPIKCTISPSFSKTISGSTPTEGPTAILKINGRIMRADCSDILSERCPEVIDSNVIVVDDKVYLKGPVSDQPKQIPVRVGAQIRIYVNKPFGLDPYDHIPNTGWQWEAGYIRGDCFGTESAICPQMTDK